MSLKRLAEEVGLAENDYLELVELFIHTTSSDLRQLQAAVEDFDAEKVFETAHSIKGAAASLGFSEIFEAARGLEMNAREGHLEGATESIRMIKERVDRIGAVLSSTRNGGTPSSS